MAQQSLGLVETAGLAAAIEAADAAVKSANVELVGYELARGDGMAAVKVRGEVGAVTAAVAAAVAAAERVGRVVSCKVIARPADAIAGLVGNRDTVGWTPAAPGADDEMPDAPLSPDKGPTGEAAADEEVPSAPPAPGGADGETGVETGAAEPAPSPAGEAALPEKSRQPDPGVRRRKTRNQADGLKGE